MPTTRASTMHASRLQQESPPLDGHREGSQPIEPLKVGIVFDGGSQRSYLTQKVKDTLYLRVEGMKLLTIASLAPGRGSPDSARLCTSL